MAETAILERTAVVRQGRRLEYFTIEWNALEGWWPSSQAQLPVAFRSSVLESIAFIEVTSGSVLLWRMSVDAEVQRRVLNERRALRIVGVCFLLLGGLHRL